ncbi:MAG: hypothetical protein ABFQ95_07750 [Pseudomonadota bacterium]
MYEPRGLDGDVRLLLPSSSSFFGHEIFEDLDALGYTRTDLCPGLLSYIKLPADYGEQRLQSSYRYSVGSCG